MYARCTHSGMNIFLGEFVCAHVRTTETWAVVQTNKRLVQRDQGLYFKTSNYRGRTGSGHTRRLRAKTFRVQYDWTSKSGRAEKFFASTGGNVLVSAFGRKHSDPTPGFRVFVAFRCAPNVTFRPTLL